LIVVTFDSINVLANLSNCIYIDASSAHSILLSRIDKCKYWWIKRRFLQGLQF